MTVTTEIRTENRRTRIRRIAAWVLLVLFVHGVAWQNLHAHEADHYSTHHDSSPVSHSEAIESFEPQYTHHGECLICRLQQQFLSIAVASSPRLTHQRGTKITSAAFFFERKFYRSAETAPVGGRGPPSPFLS